MDRRPACHQPTATDDPMSASDDGPIIVKKGTQTAQTRHETQTSSQRARCTDLGAERTAHDETYKRIARAAQRRFGTCGMSNRNDPVVERVGDGLRELDALARPDVRPRSVDRLLGGVVGEPSSGVRDGRLVCSTRLRKSRRLRAAALDDCDEAAGAGEGDGSGGDGDGERSTPLPLSDDGAAGAGVAVTSSALSREPSLLSRVSSGTRLPGGEPVDELALGGELAGGVTGRPV